MATATRWTMRQEPYDPDARDADNDGIVQEQTPWERPAGTRLVDDLGRAITRGSNATQRPRGLRVVDRQGNPVSYTPSYDKPGGRLGGGTPLGEAGAPSLRERGLPSLRELTAPRVQEVEPTSQSIVPEVQIEAPKVISSKGKTPEEIREKNARILDAIKEGGADFGTAHPDMQKRKLLASDDPGKAFGSLVTTQERTERRKEVMIQTLRGLKIYLETGDAEKAKEIGNWDEGIWDAEQDSVSFYAHTNLDAYRKIHPDLKELILNSSEEELTSMIEETLLDFARGYEDGDIGMAVPEERILDLLDAGSYKTAAVIEEAIDRGELDSTMRSTSSAAEIRKGYEETIGLSVEAAAELRPASAYITHPDIEDPGIVDIYGGTRLIIRPEVKERVAIVRGDPLLEKSAATRLGTEDDAALLNAFLNYQYEGDGKGERVVSRMLSALEARRTGDSSKMMRMDGFTPDESGDFRLEYAEVLIPGSIEMGEVAAVSINWWTIGKLVSDERRGEILESLNLSTRLRQAGASDEVVSEVEEHVKDLTSYRLSAGIKSLIGLEILKDLKTAADKHGIEVQVASRNNADQPTPLDPSVRGNLSDAEIAQKMIEETIQQSLARIEEAKNPKPRMLIG